MIGYDCSRGDGPRDVIRDWEVRLCVPSLGAKCHLREVEAICQRKTAHVDRSGIFLGDQDLERRARGNLIPRTIIGRDLRILDDEPTCRRLAHDFGADSREALSNSREEISPADRDGGMADAVHELREVVMPGGGPEPDVLVARGQESDDPVEANGGGGGGDEIFLPAPQNLAGPQFQLPL